MRLAFLLTAVILPATASAQVAPRIELAAGLATPLLEGGAFEGAGEAVRLTGRSSRPSAPVALRVDLSYASLGFSDVSSTSGPGDLTALTLGVEWRARGQTLLPFQPYVAFGLGVATGYYGGAGGGDDGRASGGAGMVSLGARRAIRRATIALDVGIAAYSPVRRTIVIPMTLALGF